MDPWITQHLQTGQVKLCPKCQVPTEKISGCNYLKCPLCQTEWCFECGRIKYTECNEKSHHSH